MCVIASVVFAKNHEQVGLKWVKEKSISKNVGVSWGVPWRRGEITEGQQFLLKNTKGENIPVQSWTMAYWPDGSVKWTGHAAVVNSKYDDFRITPDDTDFQPESSQRLQVKENTNDYLINTGTIQCTIPKSGSSLIESVKIDGRVVALDGRLITIIQKGPDTYAGKSPEKQIFRGKVNTVTIEQDGPVRAVVRMQGIHVAESGDQELIPFNVRLYFYSNQKSIRMVHTMIYDGDQNEDFIRGLGVHFSVPMREEVHNRHVRFTGKNKGLWAEPVQPLYGRRSIRYKGEEIYQKQVAGERVPDKDDYDKEGQYLISEWAAWNDYRLYQSSSDGFLIKKRTNEQSTWIDAGSGTRSTGVGFVGDVSGGLAIGVKDFWESYPSSIEIHHARESSAGIEMWMWAPQHTPMDLRHYDTTAHSLEASYEDVQEGLSTPKGIARTTELTIYPESEVPSDSQLVHKAQLSRNTPQLVCPPEYYHSIDVFGEWSLPDRSSPAKRWIENNLEKGLEYYKQQIERRNWYGFWDYGDIMHSYDPVRHTWRYDIGGFAWANTELMPDIWLWYSFLRTGDPEYYRMAEAMTRHCGEVDVYHMGKLKGLGSRHNVSHWGDGAKEVRISQAFPKRFYYYITTDERTGDLMKEVRRADTTMAKWDPLRKYEPEIEYPTHIRFGPDWLALVGNWMTAWERTGDEKWKNRILAGAESFSEMPYGVFTGDGAIFGYDPATGKIYDLGEEELGHTETTIVALQGGPEVAFELSSLLDNTVWNEMWLQYCKLNSASEDKAEEVFGVRADLGSNRSDYARLPAYAAMKLGDSSLAEQAWKQFLNSGSTELLFQERTVNPPDVLDRVVEQPYTSTNRMAQWSLNAIELLELIDQYLPPNLPNRWDYGQ